MLKDVFRQLRAAPGVSAVAVLSIALGIGAASAVYSVANALLFDLYPYRQPDRLVRYVGQLPARAFENLQKLEVFESAIATDFYNMSVTEGDLPESVKAARLSPNAFEFFGVPAFLGREFASADSPPAKNRSTPSFSATVSGAATTTTTAASSGNCWNWITSSMRSSASCLPHSGGTTARSSCPQISPSSISPRSRFTAAFVTASPGHRLRRS